MQKKTARDRAVFLHINFSALLLQRHRRKRLKFRGCVYNIAEYRIFKAGKFCGQLGFKQRLDLSLGSAGHMRVLSQRNGPRDRVNAALSGGRSGHFLVSLGKFADFISPPGIVGKNHIAGQPRRLNSS